MESSRGISRLDRALAAIVGLVVAIVVLGAVIASRNWLLLIPGLIGSFFVLSTVITLRIGSQMSRAVGHVRDVQPEAVARAGWRRAFDPVVLALASLIVLSAYISTPLLVLRWAIPGRSPLLQATLLAVFIAMLLVLATKIRTKESSRQFFRSRWLDYWFVISLLIFLPFQWVEDQSVVTILPFYVFVIGLALSHAVRWYRKTGRATGYLVGRITDRWTFMAPVLVIGLTLPVFAAISCFLAEHELWVTLVPAREGVEPFQVDEYSQTVLLDFYLWHTLNLIPGVDVPGLLRWEPDYTYEDTLSGILLILFVVAIIRPALSLYRVLRERDEPVSESAA